MKGNMVYRWLPSVEERGKSDRHLLLIMLSLAQGTQVSSVTAPWPVKWIKECVILMATLLSVWWVPNHLRRNNALCLARSSCPYSACDIPICLSHLSLPRSCDARLAPFSTLPPTRFSKSLPIRGFRQLLEVVLMDEKGLAKRRQRDIDVGLSKGKPTPILRAYVTPPHQQT